MVSSYRKTSFYSDTPIKDFYLDLWPGIDIEEQDDDLLVTIAAEHHERPDKLAYDVYGTPNLFWVFWLRNKDVLIDPIHDFQSGTKIYIPSKEYVQRNLVR